MAFLFGIISKLNIRGNTPILRNARMESSPPGSDGKLHSTHKVNNLERKFLVWTGKYKTVEEVPAYVGQNVMERARNRMRIKIANYMMAATVLGCAVMVYLGKQDHKRGDSVSQRNMDWHKRIAEESNAQESEAK